MTTNACPYPIHPRQPIILDPIFFKPKWIWSPTAAVEQTWSLNLQQNQDFVNKSNDYKGSIKSNKSQKTSITGKWETKIEFYNRCKCTNGNTAVFERRTGQNTCMQEGDKLYVKHECPRQNLGKKSLSLTLPHSQEHVTSVKCEQPLYELTFQVWLLYRHQT